MALTRDEILGMVDISTKEITIPESIPVWGGKKVYIKQLSRGDQDTYLKRQFGSNKLKSGEEVEMSMAGIYGHDAWICTRGICDETGKRIFQESDAEKLDEKSGEFVAWVAIEILKFSGMRSDAKLAKKLAASEVKQDLKN